MSGCIWVEPYGGPGMFCLLSLGIWAYETWPHQTKTQDRCIIQLMGVLARDPFSLLNYVAIFIYLQYNIYIYIYYLCVYAV